MGQIIGSAAKPKRCNLNQLSQVPTPAAGEYILVSSDNSMNAAGQGNFDCYIVGDGQTATTALPLQRIDAALEGDVRQLGQKTIAKNYEILSAPYLKNDIEIPTDATIPSAYINNDGNIVSISNTFSVKRIAVEAGKVYCVWGNATLNGYFPWVGFSKNALSVGGKIDEILLVNAILTARNIDFTFRPLEDGYIYIAVVSNKGQLAVFSSQNVSESVFSLLPLADMGASYGYYDDTSTPTYPSSQNNIQLLQIGADIDFPLFRVACNSSLGFDIGVYRFDINDNRYNLIYSKHYEQGIVDGEIEIELKNGDYVGVVGKATRGGVGFTRNTSERLTYVGASINNLLDNFTSSDITHYSNYIAWIEVTGQDCIQSIKCLYNNISALKEEQDIIKEDIAYLEAEPTHRIGCIRSTIFNTTELPSGWSNNGFTMTNDGAVSPTTGGIDKILQYSQYSDLDSSCVTIALDATSACDIILSRYGLQYPSDGANLIRFDFVNKKVIAYASAAPNTMPSTIIRQYDIPFDFVAGRYVLSVSNFAELQRYSIFGAGEVVNFYLDTRKYATATGRPHDSYGIVSLGGTYKVTQIVFSSQLEQEPDVLVVGDSITEGDTIRTEQNGGFENRWAGLLSKKTKVSIWAQGGNSSTNINNDLTVLVSMFKPKKVIYAIGTNDNNYNTWLSNCEAFTSAFEAIGAEVIYATSVLRPAYETAHAQMRSWIKASGHRYIDFCAAMSVDGLCQQNDSTLFLSDNLHPNPAGHKKMFETVVASFSDVVNL